MTMVTAAELARALNVSRTRVSQYLGEGRLEGCFSGQGRARRFDLSKSTEALRRGLHPGQMMGNGADTKRALTSLQDHRPQEVERPAARAESRDDSAPVDRYDLARTAKAEEEARKLRRLNQEAEGTFVLASEVERQTRRLIAQEIAEVEAMLRDAARAVADRLGVEFKTVRRILLDTWRVHRTTRSDHLGHEAEAAQMTADEREEDI